MIQAVGSDNFAANFRGTISDHHLEDHFSSAAGKPSPSFYRDLNHELDRPVSHMRLHDNEEVPPTAHSPPSALSPAPSSTIPTSHCISLSLHASCLGLGTSCDSPRGPDCLPRLPGR